MIRKDYGTNRKTLADAVAQIVFAAVIVIVLGGTASMVFERSVLFA
jgi:hypothetical protein